MGDSDAKSIDLQPLRTEDIDMFIGWRSRKEAQLHQPISSLDSDHLIRFIDSRLPGDMVQLRDRDYILIVRDGATGEPVGWMTIEVTSRLHGLMRMGYTIDKPYWGRGYATAAVNHLNKTMFSSSSIGRIEADCSIHNPASRRVLEKCGFSLVGVKHQYLIIHGARVDHFYFEITKQNYLLAHGGEQK